MLVKIVSNNPHPIGYSFYGRLQLWVCISQFWEKKRYIIILTFFSQLWVIKS